MQCFLVDADGKQKKNALIRKWIFDVRDIAIEAEDIIETSLLKASSVKEGGYGFYILAPNCVLNDCITLHNMGPQIDGLTSKISTLASRVQTYGVTAFYDSQPSHEDMMRNLLSEERRTYFHDETSDVVGLQDRIDQLVQQLQAHQKIVVVHGMGGIGKTTLAKEVLRHPSSMDNFEGFAWAYVSQQFQLETICRDILNQLVPDKRRGTDNMSVSGLTELLSNILRQNNCLVVLDDIWTAEDLACLAPIFSGLGNYFQSKLLITTRNAQLLSHVDDDLVSTWKAESLDDVLGQILLQKKGNFRARLWPGMRWCLFNVKLCPGMCWPVASI